LTLGREWQPADVVTACGGSFCTSSQHLMVTAVFMLTLQLCARARERCGRE
jgi:hypothetical protein